MVNHQLIMKTTIRTVALFVAGCILSAGRLLAQDEATTAGMHSVGISVGHYRYDPGISIEFTTRAIFQNHLSMRVRGSIQWLEAYKSAHYQWISYQTFSTGFVYNGMISDRARYYAEIGILGIVPDRRFSDKGFVEGIYQFNGLEIFIFSSEDYVLCLHLGVGPTFINATAEKMEGRPRYGSGLHFVNGFRMYFGR